MPATEAEERIYTAADCEAYREGDWIIAKLDGEVVLRRLTRDRAFTSAWFVWSGARSPEYEKTRGHFTCVELRGDGWRPDRTHWLRNRIEVPIQNA